MSAVAMLATPQQVALMTLGVKGFAIVSKCSNLSRHQLNSNTNGPVLLFKAMFRHICSKEYAHVT